MAAEPLVEVKNLVKHFPMSTGVLVKKKAVLKAVDDISFVIGRGETLGLVGESGCGKTTAGRTMIRLYEPTSGEMIFEDKDVFKMNDAELLAARRKMQMIFQDPYSSLNPRMTVGDIIGEPLDIHGLAKDRKERAQRIYELLSLVRLNKEHAGRFPHEFSGGQRQRIGFARALAVEPSFIVCDEPISALDVSIQAQMVNLLEEMQERLGLTYLFIAHDLSMVKHISNRVAVMYLGKIVELAESVELYKNPAHPYAQALLSAIPIPDPDVEAQRQRIILQGDVPSPINPPSGCHFRTRCRFAMPVCSEEEPVLKEIAPKHFCACHLVK
ncbi:MAG: ABC transporter ATP-binding protein [Chitinophagales bacterium]